MWTAAGLHRDTHKAAQRSRRRRCQCDARRLLPSGHAVALHTQAQDCGRGVSAAEGPAGVVPGDRSGAPCAAETGGHMQLGLARSVEEIEAIEVWLADLAVALTRTVHGQQARCRQVRSERYRKSGPRTTGAATCMQQLGGQRMRCLSWPHCSWYCRAGTALQLSAASMVSSSCPGHRLAGLLAARLACRVRGRTPARCTLHKRGPGVCDCSLPTAETHPQFAGPGEAASAGCRR